MNKIKFIAVVMVLVYLCGCQPQSNQQSNKSVSQTEATATKTFNFEGSDVRQAGLGGTDFVLLGAQNQSVHLSDFKGKVVALVFGYTHCPDVCPTTLLTYADAMQQLGEQAKKVQVLFITVDPLRDTPEVMASYAPAFDPSFIGLTTDTKNSASLNQVIKQYKINVRKIVGHSPQNYLIDHSTGTYLLDTHGKTMVYESHSQTATQIAHDIKQLLN